VIGDDHDRGASAISRSAASVTARGTVVRVVAALVVRTGAALLADPSYRQTSCPDETATETTVASVHNARSRANAADQ
jgi:hypothetical protein